MKLAPLDASRLGKKDLDANMVGCFEGLRACHHGDGTLAMPI
jgi:hypothetical protein